MLFHRFAANIINVILQADQGKIAVYYMFLIKLKAYLTFFFTLAPLF